MKKNAVLFIVASAIIGSSCSKSTDVSGTFKGTEVQVDSGKAWTWIQINSAGTPDQIGITIDDAALNNVPNAANSWILTFPSNASVSLFDHVELDWNPLGHPPPIYSVPHFDFHFYMVSQQTVAAIPPYSIDSMKFKNWPAADYFPPNYFNPGGGVPQMGTHWVDATSPEFHGQPFTQTFIYGSYDGKVTFFEPMMTINFLKNTSSFERTIPQPAKVQKTGYYPTKLRVVKHDNLTDIILAVFVKVTQS